MISTEITHKAVKIAKTDKKFAYLNLCLELNDSGIIESDEDDEDNDDGND